MAGFEPAASCSQSRRDNLATLHPEFVSANIELISIVPKQINFFFKINFHTYLTYIFLALIPKLSIQNKNT